MTITIKSIKAFIKEEENRLQQRSLENNTQQESSSISGSLMTLKKIKLYIEGKLI